MTASQSTRRSRAIAFILTTLLVLLFLYLYARLFGPQMAEGDLARFVRIPFVALWGLLAYLGIRLLNAAIFDLAFRLRRGYEAPTLARNVFTLVTFTILLVVIIKIQYPKADLGALFTTSAIFGVIIGLALQDTLGNFFAGLSLHADRPFQVGDVIVVGDHTGVVEGITWRAIKLRTFQNHIVLIANSAAGKEPIEVSPRDNLNARLVFLAPSTATRRPRPFTW